MRKRNRKFIIIVVFDILSTCFLLIIWTLFPRVQQLIRAAKHHFFSNTGCLAPDHHQFLLKILCILYPVLAHRRTPFFHQGSRGNRLHPLKLWQTLRDFFDYLFVVVDNGKLFLKMLFLFFPLFFFYLFSFVELFRIYAAFNRGDRFWHRVSFYNESSLGWGARGLMRSLR